MFRVEAVVLWKLPRQPCTTPDRSASLRSVLLILADKVGKTCKSHLKILPSTGGGSLVLRSSQDKFVTL